MRKIIQRKNKMVSRERKNIHEFLKIQPFGEPVKFQPITFEQDLHVLQEDIQKIKEEHETTSIRGVLVIGLIAGLFTIINFLTKR